MGKLALICRLIGRDVRFRPGQAVLLLLAIGATTTVLSLALALHGVTQHPYQQTRAVTRGPDVVALFFGPGAGPHGTASVPDLTSRTGRPAAAPNVQAEARTLISAPGVAGYGGPYPVASVILRLGHVAAPVEAEGRDGTAASLDQPSLTAGSWVRQDGIVLERTFADALGASVGDRVSLDGRPYTVAGIAVTAASAPYPNMCFPPGGDCVFDLPTSGTLSSINIGLAWVTEPDARALASSAAPLGYFLDLRLKDPATAQAFAAAHDGAQQGPGSGYLISWQSIAYDDGLLVQDEQQVLTPGAWLAGLLAVASVAVLAGGRMAQRSRRVGLLKDVAAGKLDPAARSQVLLAKERHCQQSQDHRGVEPVGVFQQELVVEKADQEHQPQPGEDPVNLLDVRAGKLGAVGGAVNLNDAQHADQKHKGQQHPVKIAEGNHPPHQSPPAAPMTGGRGFFGRCVRPTFTRKVPP